VRGINQAEWMMDEKVRIFLRLVWLKPPIIPTKAEEITNGMVVKLSVKDNRISGAIFCQVSRMRHCHQSAKAIT
jgi:hypothetical protein